MSQWDPARAHDSDTFSHDYNLHDSEKSFDHPSVTHDDIHDAWVKDDFGAATLHVPNAMNGVHGGSTVANHHDEDLVEVVEGRFPTRQGQQGRPAMMIRSQFAPNDSTSSIMQYLMNGSQDDIEYHIATTAGSRLGRYDNEVLDDGGDGGQMQEGNGNGWLLGLQDPAGSAQHFQNHFDHETPTTNRFLHLRPLRAGTGGGGPVRTGREENAREGSKNETRSTITNTGSVVHHLQQEQQQQQQHQQHQQQQVSAQAQSTLVNNITKNKGKAVARPQPQLSSQEQDLVTPPTSKRAATGNVVQHQGTSGQQQQQPQKQQTMHSITQPQSTTKTVVQSALPTITTPTMTTPPAPAPARFTRISKASVSNTPTKESPSKLPIIPTPQADDDMVQHVRDFKKLLERVGMKPMPATLVKTLESQDATSFGKDGYGWMMQLVQTLGTAYEKKSEIIHQLTDQIMSQQNVDDGHVGNNDRKTANSKEQREKELEQEVESLKSQLASAKASFKENELTRASLEARAQQSEAEAEMASLKSPPSVASASGMAANQNNTEDPNDDDKNNQMSPSRMLESWETVDRLLDQKVKAEVAKAAADFLLLKLPESVQQPGPIYPPPPTIDSLTWMPHILEMEKQLRELKSNLDSCTRTTCSSSPMITLPNPHTSQEWIELKSRLRNANDQIKSLEDRNELLSVDLLAIRTTSEVAGEKMIEDKKLLRDISAKLGVEKSDDIMTALGYIERVVQNLTRMKKFISKVENIVWEAELSAAEDNMSGISGTTAYDTTTGKTIKPTRLTAESNDWRERRQRKSSAAGLAEATIEIGRAKSLDSTLQRLREWSELLDVLNHVEFSAG